MIVWRSIPAPSPSRTGRFIALEGIDGAGKTTQAKLLVSALEAAGKHAVLTAEPTNGPAGARIRGAKSRLDPETEAALFTEDRREHVTQFIIPALQSGAYVVCDRYVHSSVAYQGARGIDVDSLIRENLAFAPQPDLVILLTIPLDLALSRIGCRGQSQCAPFESEEALRAVDSVYTSFEDPMLFRVDGAADPGLVHKTIQSILRSEIVCPVPAPQKR
jgi:dTMP kinase